MNENTLIAIIVVVFLAVIAFEMCTTMDEPEVEVSQPQYNHMVIHDDCRIVTDTLGNINCIWYNDMPYTLDTTVLDNL